MARNFYITVLILLCGTYIISSCVRENEAGVLPGTGTEETELTLTLKVPGNTKPATRALDKQAEDAVGEVDVYVFDSGGSLVDIGYGRNIADANSDGDMKNFTVTLQTGTNRDIMVLTNSREIIRDAYSGGVPIGESKEDFRKNLILSLSGKWNADPADSDYIHIPMWGERKGEDIDGNTSLTGTANSIKISRMLARVNVALDSSIDSDTEFKLTSVRLYNYNDAGYIIPADGANWSTDLKPYATTPTVPASATLTEGPLVYAVTGGRSLMGEIYTFEAGKGVSPHDNTPGSDYMKNTCIVVGGHYAQSAKETYYRIDFVENVNGSLEYMHILRNHSYNITIMKIGGPGKEDPDEAFESLPINIDTEVIAWNDHDMNDNTTDGQYQLTVDKSLLTFYDEGREQAMKIYTDYPRGWKIEIDPQYPFLTGKITPTADNSGSSVEVKVKPGNILDIDPGVAASDTIYYHFWITAGSMRKKIFIEHINEPELTIEIYPNELTFRRGAPNPKSVTVTVYPETSTVFFSQGALPGVSPIGSWVSGYGPASYDGLPHIGTPYQFRPDPNNTNDILGAVIMIYIKDSEGNFVSEYLTIRQMINDVLFERNPKITYPAEGGSQNMTIYSDSDWRIGQVEPNGAIFNYDNNRQEAGEGIVFPFEMESNPNFYPREIELEIVSDDPEFTPRTEVLAQGFSNPYIYLTDADITQSEINLGNSADVSTQQLKVRSNALWNYTTSGSWDIVVGNIDMTTGGSQYADQQQPDIINISTKKYPAQAGTPAAGEYTATATFRSTNHDTYPANANQATAQLTLKRTVPTHFKLTSVVASATTLPRTGGTITATGSTNGAWTITGTSPVNNSGGSGNTQVGTNTVGAGNYGTKTPKFTVANFNAINVSNNGRATATAPERVITVTHTGAGAGTATSTFRQKGYAFTPNPGHVANEAIDATGQTYVSTSISVTGDSPRISFRAAYVNGTNQKPVSNIVRVAAGTSGIRNANGALKVDANDLNTARTVTFQWSSDETTWYNINQGSQPVAPYNLGTFWLERTSKGPVTRAVALSSCPTGWKLPNKAQAEAIVKAVKENTVALPNYSHWTSEPYEYLGGSGEWWGTWRYAAGSVNLQATHRYLPDTSTGYYRCIKEK